jgi:DNA polymerase III epsilon subunit-like protein
MVAASEHLGPKLNLPMRDGRYRWVKLGFACAKLGIEFEETHRALDDARAAARVAIALGVG